MAVGTPTLLQRRRGPLVVPGEWSRRRWLAVCAAMGLALVSGVLVGAGQPLVALLLAPALPAAALVLKYPFAGIMLWFLLMPFAGLGGGVGQASPVLWAVHRVAVPALLALAVAHHLLGWKRSAFRLGIVDVGLLAFLAIGVANILFYTALPTRQLASFYDHLAVPIMFYWLIRLIAPSTEDLRRMIPVAIWTIGVQSVIGALSWVAPSVLPSQWLGRAGERVVGTFGGPGPYTIGLVFFAMFLIYCATGSRRTSSSRLLIGVVGIGLSAVLLSLSRGSWLGASVAVAGLGLIQPRLVVRLALALILLVGLLAVTPLGGALSRVTNRLNDADTVDSRVITNDAALRMISDRPVLGVGYGNFEEFDEAYKQRVGDIPLKVGGSAHNTYLNLAAEVGLPGTIAYLLTPVVLLVTTFRHRWRLRKHPESWRLILVMWLALADQFVVNNFADMIHSSTWATSIWWITLGLIAIELHRALASPAPRQIARDGRQSPTWVGGSSP